MSEVLANTLNLELAWKRTKDDFFQKETFVRRPYEIDLIEIGLNDWLTKLLNSVRTDTYRPTSMAVCDVCKTGGAVRPGAILSVEDRVMYAALVGVCYPSIRNAVEWAKDIDFSNRLDSNDANPKWIQNRFTGWSHFRRESLAQLMRGSSHVLITDIAGYYENIDIATLISDLRQSGAPTEAVTQLSVCLNRWCQHPGRGIPQGGTPSHLLAKLYFNSVDHNLQAAGYHCFHYVDDMRIFCSSITQAKKAMIDLTVLLRKRGLNLQSAKSQVYTKLEAQEIILGVSPIINRVRDKYITTIKDFLDLDNDYMTIAQAEWLLKDHFEDTGDEETKHPLELILQTYQDQFLGKEKKFDKTLFRFLIHRLGAHKDEAVVAHCLTVLINHPEMTGTSLEYLNNCNAVSDTQDALAEFLVSENAIYLHQTYLIMEWLGVISQPPSLRLLTIARQITFNRGNPLYLRSVCRKLVADYGTHADIERLEHSYSDAADDKERAEILCTIRQMEKGRRNSFYARTEGENDWNRRAVSWAKRS